LVAAIVVPVGFALSLESSHSVSSTSGDLPIARIRTSHSSLLASTSAAATAMPEIPEGAKLFAIGTALFGLAAAMRRSTRHHV
ncbi:MAG TPA: hypothetical protein VM032_11660, partial [Vicinamibacterales bacterium]|nr:hypothetical protein [Vicinamibacterales bacterium]